MSTLGATHVHRLSLSYPSTGSWRADVTLESGDAPTGKVSLTIADTALAGTVLRSGLDAPGRPRVVVVGGLGWHSEITSPLSYQSDGGVRLSTVLRDLSTRAGEPIEQPADRTVDNWLSWIAGTRSSDALAALVRYGYIAPWRVDPDGVTRFGKRTGAASVARATVMSRDLSVSLRIVGVDEISPFLPGNTVDDVVVDRLVVRETSGKLELEVYA